MRKTFLVVVFALSTLMITAQEKNAPIKPTLKNFTLGTIQELHSRILGEKRVLNIYLPEGYNDNDSLKYPVIYLLDGSADEDFIHIVGLVQFNSFEWVARLPKSIVVGIANTDRRKDFTFATSIKKDMESYPTSGQSGKFINFLETELQPYINKQYRTNTVSTIIGQSLGGLLITEILLNKPALFSNYIIISPSIWWNNGSILDSSTEPLKKAADSLQVYIAVGKEGLTPTEKPRVMEVDANLLFEKIQGTKNQKLKVFYDYLPAENHATIMHQAVLNAFKVMKPE